MILRMVLRSSPVRPGDHRTPAPLPVQIQDHHNLSQSDHRSPVPGEGRHSANRRCPTVLTGGYVSSAGDFQSALLGSFAAALTPAQPSPFDGWHRRDAQVTTTRASSARNSSPASYSTACAARTVIARETAETLAEHEPPVLAARIGQRVSFG